MTATPAVTDADLTARRALGERLRGVRSGLGFSLQDVHEKSQGRWKAVCVGSYERGDRRISAEALVGLAGFYGVDAGWLLTGTSPAVTGAAAAERAEIIALIGARR